MDKLLIEEVRRRIDRAEVVSFDIFDTLLQRPYLHPTDLFEHMGKMLRKPQFAARRVEAEQCARRNHPHLADVTLSMIYAEIDADFAPLQQVELDWEQRALRADPEVQQVYAYARKQGKRIIIASDMYLPAEFLAEALQRNGYEGWERLYVSAEAGACKHDGSLYRRMLADAAVPPHAMLHIGDNKSADVKMARKCGLLAVRYMPPARRFLKRHKAVKAGMGKGRRLAQSAWVSLLSYDWQLRRCGLRPAQSYWHELGYQYAGPVGYGYVQFVEKAAKQAGAEALLFIARDGYLLQKLYAAAGAAAPLPSAYVYAPRILNHLCRLDYTHGNDAQARAIISFFAQANPELAALAQPAPKDPHAFITQHKNMFSALAEKQLETYRAYLHKLLPSAARYALVDTITNEFSSQKIVQSALHAEVQGIYWGICEGPQAEFFSWRAFAGRQGDSSEAERERVFTKAWDFMEFLLSSPEHPVLHVGEDGSPVYTQQQNPYEHARAALYPEIAAGALQFARDVQERLGPGGLSFDAPALIRWVNAYVDHPSRRSMRHMRSIRCALDSAHATWQPLLAADVTLWQFLRTPLRAARSLKHARWRTPLQSLMLSIAKPVTLHVRGLRYITLALFPQLRRRLFTLSFSQGTRWRYQFIIGHIQSSSSS